MTIKISKNFITFRWRSVPELSTGKERWPVPESVPESKPQSLQKRRIEDFKILQDERNNRIETYLEFQNLQGRYFPSCGSFSVLRIFRSTAADYSDYLLTFSLF